MADAFVVILINVMNKEDFYRIYSDLSNRNRLPLRTPWASTFLHLAEAFNNPYKDLAHFTKNLWFDTIDG